MTCDTLWEAAEEGNLEAVKLLLRELPDPKHVTAKDRRFARTALHYGAAGGHSEIVSLLLEAAPNVEHVTAREDDGRTALHLAAERGHSGVVKLLLEAAPSAEHVTAGDYISFTALHLAALGGHSDTVIHLLKAAPNVEHVTARDDDGRTALHWAAERGHSGVVKLLLDAAPNVEHVTAREDDGRTALHWAAECGHSDTVKLLLSDPNVDANAVDGDGDTFLHLAVRRGYATVVRGVLPAFQSKLRLTHENAVGKTAVQIAYEEDRFDVERALLECEAVKNYIEALYRDRQVYVDAANAILVGAALIASVTFASWLQPPLGYTASGDSYSATSYPPSAYDPSFADVGHNIGLGVFWVFNSLSFYFAIGTVVLGACSVLPRRRIFIKDNVVKLRHNLLWTCGLLTLSVLFVLIAFATAGFIVLVPVLELRVRYMIVPTVMGGIVCLVCLSYLLDNILKESFAVWRSGRRNGHNHKL